MLLISRIASWASLIVAWVGIWISVSPLGALIVIGSSLLLLGGSTVAGLRHRRDTGDVITREAAQEAYERLRSAYLWNRIGTPVVCLFIVIYVDSVLGRSLIVGGLLFHVLTSLPSERDTLARLRTQAEHAEPQEI